MTNKIETLKKIYDRGIIAVIRTESAKKAKKISKATKDGGIDIIEITMTVPGALDIIEELADTYRDSKITIGAGSVLDAETARSCILKGAEFVVGPALNYDMIKLCNRYNVIVAAGAMTPTEVINAMEAGADIVKIFPASLFGSKIIKSIKGPIPQARLMPTGGVNKENVKEWINAGSFAVGVGGAICSGAKDNDYKKITDDAQDFVKKIKETRG